MFLLTFLEEYCNMNEFYYKIVSPKKIPSEVIKILYLNGHIKFMSMRKRLKSFCDYRNSNFHIILSIFMSRISCSVIKYSRLTPNKQCPSDPYG